MMAVICGLVHERGLDIDLGELRLAVGAQVLVAEALDDLVIAIEAGDHQQLLEQLRRLRQGEELAGMDTRRHQVVARAFGRALGQHRRFDVDEAVVIEEAAEGAGRLVAQHHVLLHLRPAQVDDAIDQAHVFGEVVVIKLERRRHRGVEYFQLVAEDLDLARRHVGILGARRAAPHLAGDPQHELAAHGLGQLEHLGTIGIADHLGEAFAVAQVDEDHAAMIAAAVVPAAEGDDLIDVGGGELTAVVGTHGVLVSKSRRWRHGCIATPG